MKRSVAALMLCVTIAGCSPGNSTSTTPPTTPPTIAAGASAFREAAAALAVADGHAASHGRPYVAPVKAITRACQLTTPAAAVSAINHFASRLSGTGITASRLTIAVALAGSARHQGVHCGKTFAEYLAEIVGSGPAKTTPSWGGYAGSVAAWNAVHHRDPARAGEYLPRRHSVDAYQVFSSGQVTSLVERFDPPVSARLALAQIVSDLLPGKVHSVYALHTGQCQQAIYLGSQLGQLLHSSSLGAFVQLSSGGGVGKTHYDDLQVNRARITPLGAVGGQPCT
jgi:hypothetical protein